jgi:hypothetical protein
MDTIIDIWFDDSRIYMKTGAGKTFSRPLHALGKELKLFADNCR